MLGFTMDHEITIIFIKAYYNTKRIEEKRKRGKGEKIPSDLMGFHAEPHGASCI